MQTTVDGGPRSEVRRSRVLLVDDEPQVLTALADVLCDDYEVLQASSPEQALNVVDAEPDLAVVLSDHRMPGMTGAELLTQLSSKSEAIRMMVTGFAELAGIIQAINSGRIFAYVTKPWNPAELRMTVRKGVEHFDLVRQLSHERKILSDIINNIPDAVYFKDCALRFQRMNPACAERLRLVDASLATGKRLGELGVPNALATGVEAQEFSVLLRGEALTDVVRAQEPADGGRVYSTTLAPVRSGNGETLGLVGISRDITARHDVTGIAKRELFLERIQQLLPAHLTASAPLAVILVELVRFREVNDTFGLAAGNALLIEVAARLNKLVAEHDTLARFDSNVFAFLLSAPGDEKQLASWLETSVFAELRAPFAIAGTELRIAYRVGVAVFPSDATDVETLVRNAEVALANARTTGQRSLFYAPSMNVRVAETLSLESKLRRAIDEEQFRLHYQPKFELGSRRIVGLEALLRWDDPDEGPVSPGRFIPVLEETGLILDVGRWVLERAAAQYQGWCTSGLTPPPIAVNVSALQLMQSGFVDGVQQVLARHPGARGALDVEITESVLMHDLVGNITKLQALKAEGCKIAIDDFGTGYSSLGYLSRLPIDALKIDRSFIVRMAEDAQDLTIVTTIISLAHSLDKKVIAEGVETEDQARLLRLVRCDQVQGYLLGRPEPAELVQARFTAKAAE